MKKRLGMILCISGIFLLIRSSIDTKQMTQLINMLAVQYWPLVLIMLGVSMMNGRKTRKK